MIIAFRREFTSEKDIIACGYRFKTDTVSNTFKLALTVPYTQCGCLARPWVRQTANYAAL